LIGGSGCLSLSTASSRNLGREPFGQGEAGSRRALLDAELADGPQDQPTAHLGGIIATTLTQSFRPHTQCRDLTN
jgi:hypothetical protein